MNSKYALRMVILLLMTLGLVAAAGAEEEPKEIGKWYGSLETGVNLLQSSYSENWSGGEKGSIVWSWLLNGTLERRFNEKMDWSNSLKLAFGQTHQQARDTNGNLVWNKADKTTDLIDLESIMRFTLGAYVDPYVSGRFESQFMDDLDPAGRGLTLNPMVFTEAAGIARKFIDEEHKGLMARLGFAFRQNSRLVFTADAPDEDTAREGSNDGGVELIVDYVDQVLDDKVIWTSRLAFYQPVFYSGKDALEELTAAQLEATLLDADIADYTTTMDIDWENILTTQITKSISVNLYLRWVYDKYDNTVKPLLNDTEDAIDNSALVSQAVRKAGQFKQTMAVGFTYNFF